MSVPKITLAGLIVHSVAKDDFRVQIDYNGKRVDANVSGHIIELCSPDESQTQTLKLHGYSDEQIAEIFPLDGLVDATYSPAK